MPNLTPENIEMGFHISTNATNEQGGTYREFYHVDEPRLRCIISSPGPGQVATKSYLVDGKPCADVDDAIRQLAG